MVNSNNVDLCIFVTSAVPDVFINAIGYCLEHHSISNVLLISITKDKGQKSSEEDKLRQIRDSIFRQLTLLQAGKYEYKNKEKATAVRDIEISPHHRMRYANIGHLPISTKVYIYSELETEIELLLQKKEHRYLFDVSAILKAYLVDVFALLLARRVVDIYAFELRLRDRFYDERDLIHNLSLDTGDYEYVNITQSQYVAGLTFETKKQLQLKEQSHQALETLIDNISTKFAKRTMLLYGISVLFIWTLMARSILLADWNKIEPWTFVFFGLPTLPYVGSVFFQLGFQKCFSLRPELMFEWLRTWRRNSVLRTIALK